MRKSFPSKTVTELRLTQLSLAVSGSAAMLLLWSTGAVAWAAAQEGRFFFVLEALLFGALAGFLVYGNLCYEIARWGCWKRLAERIIPAAHPHRLPDHAAAPGLTILVPSYKEEIPVIRQTLLSAALQDYPKKRVVLLLDDPPAPKTRQDEKALWTARSLPFDLQALLAFPHRLMVETQSAYRCRQIHSLPELAEECVRLSDCYASAAEWFEDQAKRSPIESHTDAWFVEHILTQPAQGCRAESARWFARRKELAAISAESLRREIDDAYTALATRFLVEFDVFERKQYRNLSHEPNKAMNLNSFLALMGKRVKPVLRQDGLYLEETEQLTGSRVIPDTPYVITLDADSLLQPHYARTLVDLMEQPAQQRVAVAQTPYSAFPNAPGILERTAGATTDIQYLIHQGFTRFGATFWVGANALLRKSALEEICVEAQEGDKTVRRYIQDRTVIEDTESTVDLMAKGWTLYNHPERLAYSATPPDFGSLVIQRCRWANGGLIIFPKLLSFLRRTAKRPSTIPQGLLQIHYLTSLAFAPLSVLLLLALPFSPELWTGWMPLAAAPYFILYARDLQTAGYRPLRDLLRIYALNLLLIPVHLTGAITSIRQAIAGTKIPFRRTPKVCGRTRTAGMDLVLQLSMLGLSLLLGLDYALRSQWIGAAFVMANFGLLLYGLSQLIGLTAFREDLLAGARQAAWYQQLLTAMGALRGWGLSCVSATRTTWLSSRTASSPRQAL